MSDELLLLAAQRPCQRCGAMTWWARPTQRTRGLCPTHRPSWWWRTEDPGDELRAVNLLIEALGVDGVWRADDRPQKAGRFVINGWSPWIAKLSPAIRALFGIRPKDPPTRMTGR